jgi:hypothetical protein
MGIDYRGVACCSGARLQSLKIREKKQGFRYGSGRMVVEAISPGEQVAPLPSLTD